MKKFILSLFCINLLALASFAVRAPEYYQDRIEKSKIKAMAEVIEVNETNFDKKTGVKDIEVKFKTIKALSDDTPKNFIGTCKSFEAVDDDDLAPMSGDIYYYPKVGKIVFVAILSNKGPITSFGELTEYIKKHLSENGLGCFRISPLGLRHKNCPN